MYASMYVLVYLWAQNAQLIVPWEEFPSPNPRFSRDGAKCHDGLCPAPTKEALLGAEAEPRTSPGPASCCGRNEKDPNPSTASPRACSCWVFTQTRRHRWVHDTPVHGHQLEILPPRRAREGKRNNALFSAFLCLYMGKTSSAKS